MPFSVGKMNAILAEYRRQLLEPPDTVEELAKQYGLSGHDRQSLIAGLVERYRKILLEAPPDSWD
jgi:hypothetical protein